IILYLQNNQIKYDNKKIDIILKNSNEKENTIELEKNTFFIKQQNFGYILKKNFPVIEKKENIKYKKIKLKNIKNYENYNFNNKNFVFQIGSQSQLKQLEKDINKKLNIFCKKVLYIDLKYDKIFGDIVLRSRQQGDKITLQKRNVTKSLKKLFNEMKISKEEREKILAVVLKDIIISSNICSFQKETDKVLKLIIY
ncbi:MAG: tRNA lysidine(34) synthetase TilS, partial [Oscillospiraceae bacterium]